MNSASDPGAEKSAPPPLRPVVVKWLLATGILLLALFLVLEDLMGANRPHELHNTPWVAGLTLLNLLPCKSVFAGLRSHSKIIRGEAEPKMAFYLLAGGLAVVASLNILTLVGALGNLPAVLGD